MVSVVSVSKFNTTICTTVADGSEPTSVVIDHFLCASSITAYSTSRNHITSKYCIKGTDEIYLVSVMVYSERIKGTTGTKVGESAKKSRKEG